VEPVEGSKPAETFRDQSDDSANLVFAICHEISNLVAAVRLKAHLLDEDLDTRGLAVASLEIDDLSARSATLLALVRPVLVAPSEEIPPIGAGVIALGFERALAEYGGRGLEIVFEIEPQLPDVRAESEVFHYLLLCHAYGAMEAMGTADMGGRIRIEVSSSEKEVVFAVEDQAPADEEHLKWWKSNLRGRALESALANYVLTKRGARFEVQRRGDCNRTEIVAPRV
jgi:nitrogen-specific signal transduction histidine kinase